MHLEKDCTKDWLRNQEWGWLCIQSHFTTVHIITVGWFLHEICLQTAGVNVKRPKKYNMKMSSSNNGYSNCIITPLEVIKDNLEPPTHYSHSNPAIASFLQHYTIPHLDNLIWQMILQLEYHSHSFFVSLVCWFALKAQ